MGNARIESHMRMYLAAVKGDWRTVKECQRRINLLYGIIRLCGNPIAAAKAAAELSGRGRWMRQGSQRLTDEQMKEVAKILREFDKSGRVG